MASGDTSVSKAVVEYLRQKKYRQVETLGKGGFGEVLSAISPTKEKVAIKIVENKKSWHIEELIWPVLNHKNILPLEEVIDVPHLDIKLFVMPKIPYVLDKMLCSKNFMRDETGLKRIKRWMSNVQEGLNYLHTSGFAHLDLKKDNVLITEDDQALLCDFSGLNLTGVPLRRLCAPLRYRPPEYYDDFRCKYLEGTKCDIWLYGLMVLNILTRNWPFRRMGKVTDKKSWKINVEPILMEALKKSVFFENMKASFPSVALSKKDITSAHDFVVSLMQWDMNKRPSIQEIESHPFLARAESRNVLIEERHKFKEMKNVVTNPFLDGWINLEAVRKNEPVEKYKRKKDKRKDMFKNSQKHCHINQMFVMKNIVTNPFLKGWVGTEDDNENIPDQETEKENSKQSKTLNVHSYQQVEKTKMANNCSNVLPGVGGLIENNISVTFINTCAVTEKLPKEKKKVGGALRRWIAKKWNKVFKRKKNSFVRLSEESE